MVEDPSKKYGWVQYPAITPFDPATIPIPPGALKSYQYIARFTAKDTAPIAVVDAATQAARDCQIVRLAKAIVGSATQDATDDQILALHNSYMDGAF